MAGGAGTLTTRLAGRFIRVACRLLVQRIDLRVEGVEHIPASGPVVIAARHFHHLWDGCALIAASPRPLHVVVALDWLHQPVGRRLMDEVQAIAAANGANIVELIATSANVAAREFYRSFGFVETDHVALEFVGDVHDPPDPEEDRE